MGTGNRFSGTFLNYRDGSKRHFYKTAQNYFIIRSILVIFMQLIDLYSDYVKVKQRGKGLRRALVLLAAILLYCMFLRVSYCLLKFGNVFPDATVKDSMSWHLINLLPMIMMTYFTVFIIFLLTEPLKISRNLWAKIALDFIITFSLMLAAYGFFILLYRSTFKPDLTPDIAGILVYYITTFLVAEMIYYIRHSREALRKAEYAKREVLQYKYDALRAHVNPHFLFNSLNVLVAIIDTDPPRATEFTIALSRIYRYVLAMQSKTTVPISEELDFLQSYIHILKIKYGDSFNVVIRGTEDCEKKIIIPFTLQLLVENITKHNTITEKYPMEVTIDIGDRIMTVSNPIKLKKSDTLHLGIGLHYLSSLYLANDKIFEVEDNGERFTAKIPFI